MALADNNRSDCMNITEELQHTIQQYDNNTRKIKDFRNNIQIYKEEITSLEKQLNSADIGENNIILSEINDLNAQIYFLESAIDFKEDDQNSLKTIIRNLNQEFNHSECYLFFSKPDTGLIS